MFEHIEKHLPELRKLVTTNALKNDALMKVILGQGYNLLIPGVVKVFIKEETFVGFCLENKHSLFGEPAQKVIAKGKAKPDAKKVVKKVTDKKRK